MRALFLFLLGCSRAPAIPDASPCGSLECTLYDTPEAAFARVLADEPTVLAIGETHAQKGFEGESTTTRFTEKLLPMLRGKSKDLVLELWIGNSSCTLANKKAVEHVQSAQGEVTRGQSPKNQSEFITLWNAAKKNEMTTHLLVPPCEDYAKIASAPDDIDAMLSMIAKLTAAKAESLLPAPVVIYGGAMHNDLEPRHPAWSFGPELDRKTKYIELDLIVPEMIRDDDAWRAQPWYDAYKPQGNKTILFHVRPHSYALIFGAR